MKKQNLVDITCEIFGEGEMREKDLERYQLACSRAKEYFEKQGIKNPSPMELLKRVAPIYLELSRR